MHRALRYRPASIAMMLLVIVGSACPSFGQVPPFVTAWGGFGPGDAQFQNPVGVAVDAAGVVYVGDNHANVVKRFTRTGAYLSQWPAFDPLGIAIGPDGNVYMTQGGDRSRRLQLHAERDAPR